MTVGVSDEHDTSTSESVSVMSVRISSSPGSS